MSKEHAPLSRKEEEEKKAAEAQPQSGLSSGKFNSAFNRWMDKRSPIGNGSRFKKKSTVSQPGDASEVQADAVAKAVTAGNANAAQVELQNDVTSGEITAKASDVTIETPPGFDEKIKKMKGGGLPLPDDKKAGLEEMLGTELDHVRLHTGADAAELAAGINAFAFATGDDIFYPGDLNDEELLAHEVTHVVQGGGGSADITANTKKINRYKDPDVTLPMTVTFPTDITATDVIDNKHKNVRYWLKEAYLMLGVELTEEELIEIEKSWSWQNLKTTIKGNEPRAYALDRTQATSLLNYVDKYTDDQKKLIVEAYYSSPREISEFLFWLNSGKKISEPGTNSPKKELLVEYDIFVINEAFLMSDNAIYQVCQQSRSAKHALSFYLKAINKNYEAIDTKKLASYLELASAFSIVDFIYFDKVYSISKEQNIDTLTTNLKAYQANQRSLLSDSKLMEQYEKDISQDYFEQSSAVRDEFKAYNLSAADQLLFSMDNAVIQVMDKAVKRKILREDYLQSYLLASQSLHKMVNNIDDYKMNEYGVYISVDLSDTHKKNITDYYNHFFYGFYQNITADAMPSANRFVLFPSFKTAKIRGQAVAGKVQESKLNAIKKARTKEEWNTIHLQFYQDVYTLTTYLAKKVGENTSEGQAMIGYGQIGLNTVKLMSLFPNATFLHFDAYYFPEPEEDSGQAKGKVTQMPWHLIIVKEQVGSGYNYHLYDVTRADMPNASFFSLETDEARVYSLIEEEIVKDELTTKDWMPKGKLQYRFPNGLSGTIETGRKTVGIWLKEFGTYIGLAVLALLAIAAAGFTGGASIWAAIEIGALLSGVLIGVGALLRIGDMRSVGLDSVSAITLEIADAIAGLTSSAGLSARMLGRFAVSARITNSALLKLAVAGDRLIIPLEMASLGGSTVGTLIVTRDIYLQVQMLKQSNDKDAGSKILKLISLATLSAGLMYIGFRGGISAINKHIANGGTIYLDVDINGQMIAKLIDLEQVTILGMQPMGAEATVDDIIKEFAATYHSNRHLRLEELINVNPVRGRAFIQRYKTLGAEAYYLADGDIEFARQIVINFMNQAMTTRSFLGNIINESTRNRVRNVIGKDGDVRIIQDGFETRVGTVCEKQGQSFQKTEIEGMYIAEDAYGLRTIYVTQSATVKLGVPVPKFVVTEELKLLSKAMVTTLSGYEDVAYLLNEHFNRNKTKIDTDKIQQDLLKEADMTTQQKRNAVIIYLEMFDETMPGYDAEFMKWLKNQKAYKSRPTGKQATQVARLNDDPGAAMSIIRSEYLLEKIKSKAFQGVFNDPKYAGIGKDLDDIDKTYLVDPVRSNKQLVALLYRVEGLKKIQETYANIKAYAAKTKGVSTGDLKAETRTLAFGDYNIYLTDAARVALKKQMDDFISMSYEYSQSTKSGVLPDKFGGYTKMIPLPPANKPRYFSTFPLNPNSANMRTGDAEVKFYEFITAKLETMYGQVFVGGQTYTQFRGKITMFVEQAPCPSCTDAIHLQFNKMFPNIELEIKYGVQQFDNPLQINKSNEYGIHIPPVDN